MRKGGLLLAIVLLISFFGAPCPVQAAAATYYFSPNNIKLNVGQTATVTLFVTTDQAINAGDGTVVLPASQVSGVSVSGSGSIFANWPENPSLSGSSIRFAGGLPTPGYQGAGGRVFSFTIRGTSEGTGLITLSGGRILANNASSTNIFSGASTATVTVTRTVSGAAITSTTHPDPSKWYKTKDLQLSWSRPAGVSNYSYTLSHSGGQPSRSGSGNQTSASFNGLADGIWTFSLTTTYTDGKTATSSFTSRIDTAAPAAFSFKTERVNGSTDPSPTLTFSTTDTPSGIERYEIVVGTSAPVSTTETSYKIPKLKPGKHPIIIRAIDRAGNVTESLGNIDVDGFSGPVITEYPSLVSIFQSINLRGKALYGAKVQLFISGNQIDEFTVKDHVTKEQKSRTDFGAVTPDTIVEWEYSVKNGQFPGYKLLYATQSKPDGAESNQSNQVQIYVAPDSMSIFGFQLPFFLVAIGLLAVLIGGPVPLFLIYRRVVFVVGKRRKKRDEEVVKEKMTGLQHDLEKRISSRTKNPDKIIDEEIQETETAIIKEIENGKN